MEFEFRPRPASAASRIDPEGPMRILVLADLCGAARSGAAPLAERRPARIDLDEFGNVLTRLAPRAAVTMTDGDPPVEIPIRDLESFEPDRLYASLDVFGELRRMRSRLSDPATFRDAADELMRGAEPAPPPAPSSPADGNADAEGGSVFEQLLGGSPGAAAPATAPAATGATLRPDIRRFVSSLIEPHLVPATDPQQPQLVATVDDAIAATMRRILHDAGFRALEAAWRGVRWLVDGLETDEQLQLSVLDVSRQELLQDQRDAAGDASRSALHAILVERDAATLGGQPWSALVCDCSFAPGAEDAGLLGGLADVAAAAGGPILAAASPAAAGCPSLLTARDPREWSAPDDEHWRALRASSRASWIGLALPRILLRRPYGRRSEPVESFDFEELGASAGHEQYLWGNASFACAMLLGMAFTERQWSMEPGDVLEIGDLPTCTRDEDGERRLVPCAEVLLNDRAVDAMLARGLMPLQSHASANVARLARFQSIADPPTPLSGPWA
jgi:type VI secretion system protein ImpC